MAYDRGTYLVDSVDRTLFTRDVQALQR